MIKRIVRFIPLCASRTIRIRYNNNENVKRVGNVGPLIERNGYIDISIRWTIIVAANDNVGSRTIYAILLHGRCRRSQSRQHFRL